MRSFHTQRGLTLIELLVGIAILVIALAVGVPSFEGVGNSSRLATAANELGGAVQLARAEAVRRNRNVVLCRSADGSSCAAGAPWAGWIVFADADGDDQRQASETIIRAGTLDGGVQARASAAISGRSDRITFQSNGLARGSDSRALLNAQLAVCIASTRPADNERDVAIGFGSRVSVTPKNAAGACATPADS